MKLFKGSVLSKDFLCCERKGIISMHVELMRFENMLSDIRSLTWYLIWLDLEYMILAV